MEGFPEISVIIPALNAAASLVRTIESVSDIAAEIIVVDGGSSDGTREIAQNSGARVIVAEPGRGSQLAAGALEAEGDWFLFLHADTVLGAGWPVEVASFVSRVAGDGTKAAAFRFALDDDSRKARWLERVVAWRCRRFGLAWGDQGLLIGRTLYDSVGGYRCDMPLFEDADFIRRIGRARLQLLETPAATSAEKYRRDGYLKRCLRNGLCLSAYFLNISPATIRRYYR